MHRTHWGDDDAAVATVWHLLHGADRPDGIFATSFFRFFPFLRLLEESGLRHPGGILLAGFDEPMESWATDTVRQVIRGPLLVVRQAATEMGYVAVEMALAAIDGAGTRGQQRVIRPALSWRETQ